METFLRSEEQRVDALGVIVWSLVPWAAAREVEAFAEAVCPVAPVGFAEQVESDQIEQLGQAGAVGERADAVADPAVDLTQNLLDGAGRVDAVRVAGRDLRLGHAAVCFHPPDGERERSVLAARVFIADCLLERCPCPLVVERVWEGPGDRVPLVGEDRVREVLTQLSLEVPFALAVLDVGISEDAPDRQPERVVGVADDHPRRAVQGPEECLPGGLILV